LIIYLENFMSKYSPLSVVTSLALLAGCANPGTTPRNNLSASDNDDTCGIAQSIPGTTRAAAFFERACAYKTWQAFPSSKAYKTTGGTAAATSEITQSAQTAWHDFASTTSPNRVGGMAAATTDIAQLAKKAWRDWPTLGQ
jgi:hypothetical protein